VGFYYLKRGKNMEIIKKEFIFKEHNSEYECHASTLLKKGNRIICAWFEGTKEKSNDVKIKLSIYENGVFKEPKVISAKENTPHWNPVLFDLGDKIALYFKVGFEIKDWVTYISYSFDGGLNFTNPEILIEKDFSGGRGPVKNKPIRLNNGRILCPASTEQGKWLPFCDISDDNGESYKKINIPCENVGLIQPSFWQDKEGEIHALMRSNNGFIYRSDSSDFGKSWCLSYKTNMPNNNSGIDLVKLKDGRIILICNPVEGNWAARSPLSLYISDDNGDNFTKIYDLETVKGEFSYPSVINEKEKIYITYTYNRKNIVYCEIKI